MIIRLSLKISGGFFQVVSLASQLIWESSVLGPHSSYEGWEFPCGREAASPAAVEDLGGSTGGRQLQEEVSHGFCWAERVNPGPAGGLGSLAAPALPWPALRLEAVEQGGSHKMQQLPVTKITPI